MNIKDVLSADLPTAVQWAKRGLSWWIDELSHVLPLSWRRHFSAQPAIVAEFDDRTVSLRGKGGRSLDPAALSSHERDHVRIVVPLKRVLTRILEYPLLPMNDIRRIVALEIDKLTPFRPEAVYFDTELIRRDAEKGRQQILLGVLPKNAASEFLSRAESLGVVPIAFGASGGVGSNVHFDFLPALRTRGGTLGARARVPYWWVAVAALMALNVALLSYRDSADVDSLQQIVDSQAGPVEVAMRLRSKVEAEAERRTTLVEHLRKSSPLHVIEAVTKALPPNAWTQTFEWNGQTIHLVGYSNGPAAMLRALESSPALHNARTMSHDVVPVKQVGMQPFDVAVDAGKGSVR
ncbi:MAG TPA: PilN domain-containing protein [Rhizomicrobium sp.]